MTIPFDSDANRAAVTMAAQRISAYADAHGIVIDEVHCEDIAQAVVQIYQAFHAGLLHRPQVDDAPQSITS
ncbi:hypothetical protein [Phytohabitans houttuyneae]|uniref:Uncharacterized protein n=1 Tax=Phytohabitans houttuyneae TaxID=1076126 RepID=A0A6V8K6N2_9ACTN|nr:hypothetical protein [Phytohabitans houttuyneae]GFJ77769.1 hypothetical protein Phou_019490 [Phytohabitans houttuyneae]